MATHGLGVGGGTGAERTLFFGPRIPQQVKALAKELPSLDKQIFRSLIKLICSEFEGKEVPREAYGTIKNSCDPNVNLDVIFSGLHTLFKTALRLPESSLKQEVFKEDLKELKIPEECIADIASVLYGSRRSAMEKNCAERGPNFPSLVDFKWRVDVGISSSALSRIFEPAILMEMTTSDGNIETFEVSPEQFHKLRFTVANLLKDVSDLEKRSVLKN